VIQPSLMAIGVAIFRIADASAAVPRGL